MRVHVLLNEKGLQLFKVSQLYINFFRMKIVRMLVLDFTQGVPPFNPVLTLQLRRLFPNIHLLFSPKEDKLTYQLLLEQLGMTVPLFSKKHTMIILYPTDWNRTVLISELSYLLIFWRLWGWRTKLTVWFSPWLIVLLEIVKTQMNFNLCFQDLSM